jgi:hypothetical protein
LYVLHIYFLPLLHIVHFYFTFYLSLTLSHLYSLLCLPVVPYISPFVITSHVNFLCPTFHSIFFSNASDCSYLYDTTRSNNDWRIHIKPSSTSYNKKTSTNCKKKKKFFSYKYFSLQKKGKVEKKKTRSLLKFEHIHNILKKNKENKKENLMIKWNLIDFALHWHCWDPNIHCNKCLPFHHAKMLKGNVKEMRI